MHRPDAPILLVLTQVDTITYRRYALVAAALIERGVPVLVLDLPGHLAGDFARSAKTVVTSPPQPISLIRPPSPPGPPPLAADTGHYRAKGESNSSVLPGAAIRIRNHLSIDSIRSAWGSLEALVQEQVQRSVDTHLGRFLSAHKTAYLALGSLKPRCVVLDNWLPTDARAFLLACREQGIPTVSMEHCEGFWGQYSRIAFLPDHAIAYGDFNRKVLIEMGVPEKRIHVTGSPETDIVSRLDKAQLRRELRSELGVAEKEEVLAVALRSWRHAVHHQMNADLLRACGEVVARRPSLRVVVKAHPADLATMSMEEVVKKVRSATSFACVDPRLPIQRFIASSDEFVAHNSSAIVDAVLLDIPCLVVATDELNWPDWTKYGIPVVDLPAGLVASLGVQPLRCSASLLPGQRAEFIRDFRHRLDDRASHRIAEVLERLTRDE